jgi:Na+-transporting NADH:ubiquinone oxidoreductase subunit A
VSVHEFEGPHPAGLPGTHIHFVDPVREGRSVWHLGYADVAAVGTLQRTGRLPVERIVAVAGPRVEQPALVRARLGASVADLIAGRVAEGAARVVSGCVLAGRTAVGPTGYLGRYHQQVTVIEEADDGPGYSRLPVFPRAWRRGVRALTTAAHGPRRALVPIDVYERVWPLDLFPMPLFKVLAIGDIARSVERGCLELDEEDLALAAFVCPSKSDFGADLRRVLTALEKEG